MILVADIMADIQRILGTCDQALTFNRLNEAQQLLKSLGIFDPGIGYMDICCDHREIVLPDDVDVPLAINVGGQPADFRNKWFQFHLNGPGSDCITDTAVFSWMDDGNFPTFRTIENASTLMAIPKAVEAPTASIRIFGFDQCNQWIMTPDCNGALVDGFEIPILSPSSPSTQMVKRITRVSKPITVGFVDLVALDLKEKESVLLGHFKPTDTEPQYRRIHVSGVGCNRLDECRRLTSWVRMRFRKKHFKINSLDDQIFLHSPSAVKFACQAIKKAEDDLPDGFVTYMGLAKQALMNEQKFQSGPNRIRIQFDRGTYGSMVEENMI